MMRGIYPATLTPFDKNNKVNTQAIAALLELNLSQGADGFFLGGSSAECFLLSEQERITVFEAAAAFKDKTNLIAHVGAISTGEAIHYARAAKALGYPFISATPPFYYGFGPKDVARYYYEIAAAVDMPVLIYNFPDNTGKPFNLYDPVIQELFRSGAVCGIKHTNRNIAEMERIKNLNPALNILNGFDENMVAGLAVGADGNIGSTFNVLMPQFRKVYDAYQAGDYEDALKRQIRVNNVMDGMYQAGLIPAIKYILSTIGIDPGEPRSPFAPLGDDAKRFIDGVLAEHLQKD